MATEIAVRPDELRAEVEPVVAQANALIVRNVDEHAAALRLLSDVRRAKKLVKAKTDPLRDATHKAWKEAIAFAASFLDPLDEADRTITRKAGAFEEQRRREAEEERRRLEAEALAEQERQREMDAAMAETPEEAEEALTAPLAPPTVEVEPEIARVAGVSGRGVWSAEVTDKGAFVRWCLETPHQLFLVEPNQAMLNQLARNQHDELHIPGVKARCTRAYAAR